MDILRNECNLFSCLLQYTSVKTISVTNNSIGSRSAATVLVGNNSSAQVAHSGRSRTYTVLYNWIGLKCPRRCSMFTVTISHCETKWCWPELLALFSSEVEETEDISKKQTFHLSLYLFVYFGNTKLSQKIVDCIVLQTIYEGKDEGFITAVAKLQCNQLLEAHILWNCCTVRSYM